MRVKKHQWLLKTESRPQAASAAGYAQQSRVAPQKSTNLPDRGRGGVWESLWDFIGSMGHDKSRSPGLTWSSQKVTKVQALRKKGLEGPLQSILHSQAVVVAPEAPQFWALFLRHIFEQKKREVSGSSCLFELVPPFFLWVLRGNQKENHMFLGLAKTHPGGYGVLRICTWLVHKGGPQKDLSMMVGCSMLICKGVMLLMDEIQHQNETL